MLPTPSFDNVVDSWESTKLTDPDVIFNRVVYNGAMVLLYNVVVVLYQQGKSTGTISVSEAREQMLNASRILADIAGDIKQRSSTRTDVNVTLFVSSAIS